MKLLFFFKLSTTSQIAGKKITDDKPVQFSEDGEIYRFN